MSFFFFAGEDEAPPEPPPVSGPRAGLVRLSGHGLSDDHGRFFAIGTSLFWSPWGWRHERQRWEDNCGYLMSQGCDFTRDFMYTAWEPDRVVRPDTEGLEAFMQTTVEWVRYKWDHFGLRSWLTFLPGNDYMNSDSRHYVAAQLPRRFLLQADKGMLLGLSVGNETGKFMSSNENWSLGRDMHDGCEGKFLLGLGAGEQYAGGPHELYAPGNPSSIYETDLERSTGFRNSRQPYGQPAPWVNVEPGGPYTDPSETDPYVLVAQAAMVFMNQGAIHCLHASGTGTSGGSAYDLAHGKPANWWDVQNAEQIFQGLRTVRSVLPDDIAEWGGTLHTHFSNEGRLPFHVYIGSDWDLQGYPPMETRCYTAQKDGRFVSCVLGQVNPIKWIATRRQSVTVRHLLTGDIKQQKTLDAEQDITLDANQGSQYVIGAYL